MTNFKLNSMLVYSLVLMHIFLISTVEFTVFLLAKKKKYSILMNDGTRFTRCPIRCSLG